MAINNIRGILFLYLLINEVDGSQHMVMVEYWSRDLVLDYVHFVLPFMIYVTIAQGVQSISPLSMLPVMRNNISTLLNQYENSNCLNDSMYVNACSAVTGLLCRLYFILMFFKRSYLINSGWSRISSIFYHVFTPFKINFLYNMFWSSSFLSPISSQFFFTFPPSQFYLLLSQKESKIIMSESKNYQTLKN